MKNLMILIMVCLLPACGIKHYSAPEQGITLIEEVGGKMVEEGWGLEYDCSVIETEAEFQVEGSNIANNYTATIPAAIFVKTGDSYYENVYKLSSPVKIKRISKFTKNETIESYQVGLMIPDSGEPYIVPYGGSINLTPVDKTKPISYKLKQKSCYDTSVTSQKLNRVLIYQGGANKIVHISYREFYDSLARPAFTQDVTYDLNQSDIIGFREVRIKVLEADNVSIKYVVLKQFDYVM